MARAFYVISYDIPDDRCRSRVAHLLEGYGERVQYSVFEVWLTERQLGDMKKRLAREVEESGSVRIYFLCAACREHREVLGEGEPTQELGLLIV